MSAPDPTAAAGAGDRATERVVSAPCARCGGPIQIKARGRRARYCSRSCRQRAYEVRTAAARHAGDLAAGRIRVEPAERVIERTVLAKHPTRPADWVRALAELAEQVRAGRIGPWDHERIRVALAGVHAAMDDLPPVVTRTPAPVYHLGSAADRGNELAGLAGQLGAVVQDLLTHLRHVAGRTSLERVSATTGHDPATIRTALVALADAGEILVYRQLADNRPVPVDPYTLSPHAGFHADLRPR